MPRIQATILLLSVLFVTGSGVCNADNLLPEDALKTEGTLVAIVTATKVSSIYGYIGEPGYARPWADIELAVEEVLVGDPSARKQELRALGSTTFHFNTPSKEAGFYTSSGTGFVFPQDRLVALLIPLRTIDGFQYPEELQDTYWLRRFWVIQGQGKTAMAAWTERAELADPTAELSTLEDVFAAHRRIFRREKHNLTEMKAKIRAEKAAADGGQD